MSSGGGSSRAGSSGGIVVVDLWPIVRLGIGKVLAGLSYGAPEEADGAGRARVSIRRRPALVILGSHLEEGPAALVELAKAEGARALVLVDGPSRAELAALAKAGADGILTGSSSAEELTSGIRRVMDGQRALSSELVAALAGLADPPAPTAASIRLLTPREHQVLACLVQGVRNDEIASQLFVSPATVKSHLSSIYTKLEVRGRSEATARAVQLGLAHP